MLPIQQVWNCILCDLKLCFSDFYYIFLYFFVIQVLHSVNYLFRSFVYYLDPLYNTNI